MSEEPKTYKILLKDMALRFVVPDSVAEARVKDLIHYFRGQPRGYIEPETIAWIKSFEPGPYHPSIS